MAAMPSPHMLIAALLMAAEPAPTEAARAPTDDGWMATVELGMVIPLLDDTTLGDQLRLFGYELSTPGFRGAVTIDRALLDWLRVGGSVAYDSVSDQRPRDGAEASLTHLTAVVYLQPTLCLSERCRWDGGAYFGFRLAVGGGPTFWSLRGQDTIAAHIMLEPSLLWDLAGSHWGVGLRIGYSLVSQLGIGPLELTTGLTWSPTITTRVMYRW